MFVNKTQHSRHTDGHRSYSRADGGQAGLQVCERDLGEPHVADLGGGAGLAQQDVGRLQVPAGTNSYVVRFGGTAQQVSGTPGIVLI